MESEQRGDVLADTSLFHYYINHCSYYSEDDQDADVHLKQGKSWFHMTCADDVAMSNWILNENGEIALICNKDIPNEVLEAKPHYSTLSREMNKNDLFGWGTTSFIGAIDFMCGHHGQDLNKGTVLHCFVFTPLNEAHCPAGSEDPRVWQFKPLGGGNIGNGHGCIVQVRGSAVPCQVLRIEFVKDYVPGKTCLEDMVRMTAIRVNGKMKAGDKVDIDTKEKGRFVITKEGGIRCEL